jgi:O-antigen/teichoic acid export membrane protein
VGEGSAATRRSLAGVLALPNARSPLWIAAGGAYAGLTTYVLLVLTARALGPDEYGVFSLFWSAFVLVSIGVFLPIEQVLARRRAGVSDGGLLGAGIRVGLVCAGITAGAIAAFQLIARSGNGVALSALVAFTVGAAGFALQSPSRGVLSGRLDLRQYAAVISVDGTVRTASVIVLWAVGAHLAAPYVISVGASALVAGIVGIWLVRGGDATGVETGSATTAGPVKPPGEVRTLWSEASGLVVALMCMQALLNSPVLVAGAFAESAAFTGRLMAIAAVARVPVFLTQAGQATYMGRIASAHHKHDQAAVRRLVMHVARVVGAMAVLTLLGAVTLGPQLLRLVFGPEYVVSRLACTLVAAGVGVYLIASVANDISVAVGAHGRAAVTWLLAAVAGAVPAVVLDDIMLRSTMPMLVGSAVAAAAVLPRIVRALRRDGASPTP